MLEWALDADPELGVELVIELTHHWVTSAPGEGQRWLQLLLDREPRACLG